jgi:predicted PurR-regulated permease PerM
MISTQRLPYWLRLGVIFPLVFLNGWLFLLLCEYLRPIPEIVLSASLIAFLLDYPILFLERRSIPRGLAITLVVLLTLFLLSLLGFVIGPLVFQQLVDFANKLPAWIEEGQKQLATLDQQPALQRLPIDVSSITTQLANQLSTALRTLTSRLIGFTLNTINSTVNFIVTIVLTILLVLNGKRLWSGILSWLSPEWNQKLQLFLQQSFQSYFLGQSIVASILGVALALTFEILKVPFGLLFGVAIGAASLIPFGGTFSIIVVSLLLVLQNPLLGLEVFVTAIIVAQINENAVAPRLLGGITGLNPVVIIVSLLLGVKIGGFLGLLLAVPTASLIRRIIDSIHTPNIAIAVEAGAIDLYRKEN